ncbi:tetraspanin-18B-like [Clavelina lepadiformis]|uniref:Tetraspanin n=1 Tax=Clavelina lepadiformis TaxID=159417 RepID=A0ABP0F0J2_CLALP
MSGDTKCCKYLMFVFNLLIFLGGAAMLGTGIWVLVGGNSFKQLFSANPVIFSSVYIIIAVGSFLLVIGFLGCCGAIKENKCLLGTFFLVILIIFILEIVGGVLAFVFYPDAKQTAIDSMNLYGVDSEQGKSVTAAWDAIQENLNCCGINSPGDWTLYSNYKLPPASCGGPNEILKRPGCEEALKMYFYILAGVAIAVLVIELLAMIFACCIFQNVDNHSYEY